MNRVQNQISSKNVSLIKMECYISLFGVKSDLVLTEKRVYLFNLII